ncbi:MAG TPA: alpha/beta hydrolase-fold protein [Anaerolineaceae bacterium]
MKIEYHKNFSPILSQDMEFKVYGHAGKPILVFPAQGGRFFEFEDFGMIATVNERIEAGEIQIITPDSLDNQTWANWNAHPAERAARHEAYDQYICKELIPFLRERLGIKAKAFTTGVSMGGYHCTNFFFRHPDIFDGVIALSGIMQLKMFIGDYSDDLVYFNSPLSYLPNLSDPWYLERYRKSQIVICVGQGAWEEPMLFDARQLKEILAEKQIPAWIDFWGYDVNHDWPWWRKQFPYFLSKMDLSSHED